MTALPVCGGYLEESFVYQPVFRTLTLDAGRQGVAVRRLARYRWQHLRHACSGCCSNLFQNKTASSLHQAKCSYCSAHHAKCERQCMVWRYVQVGWADRSGCRPASSVLHAAATLHPSLFSCTATFACCTTRLRWSPTNSGVPWSVVQALPSSCLTTSISSHIGQ